MGGGGGGGLREGDERRGSGWTELCPVWQRQTTNIHQGERNREGRRVEEKEGSDGQREKVGRLGCIGRGRGRGRGRRG